VSQYKPDISTRLHSPVDANTRTDVSGSTFFGMGGNYKSGQLTGSENAALNSRVFAVAVLGFGREGGSILNKLHPLPTFSWRHTNCSIQKGQTNVKMRTVR